MGRAPCCEKVGLNRGPWTTQEDKLLIDYINHSGHGNWRKLPKKAGLLRCGKSCRLRWLNYLRPDLKRGDFSKEEEDTLIKLQQELGNKWSAIAKRMPGRTDNEIKNVWNTHLKKKVQHHISTPTQTKRRQHSRKKTKIVEEVVTQNHETQPKTTQDVEETLGLLTNKSVDENGAKLSSSDGYTIVTEDLQPLLGECALGDEYTIVTGLQPLLGECALDDEYTIVTKDLQPLLGECALGDEYSSSVSVATSHNDGPTTTTTFSDDLNKFLEIEDDFGWSDIMSADLSNEIITSSDGNFYDDNMEFWYNVYSSTRDLGIED